MAKYNNSEPYWDGNDLRRYENSIVVNENCITVNGMNFPARFGTFLTKDIAYRIFLSIL